MMSSESHSDSSVITILPLHPYELELLEAIRNRWKYGELTIIVREGLPFRWKRVQEFEDAEELRKERVRKARGK